MADFSAAEFVSPNRPLRPPRQRNADTGPRQVAAIYPPPTEADISESPRQNEDDNLEQQSAQDSPNDSAQDYLSSDGDDQEDRQEANRSSNTRRADQSAELERLQMEIDITSGSTEGEIPSPEYERSVEGQRDSESYASSDVGAGHLPFPFGAGLPAGVSSIS